MTDIGRNPLITAIRKNPSAAELDPLLRILLKNRKSTTGLLERLTGTAVAAESSNSVRNRMVFRSAVLTAAGRILVFARARIALDLLPRQARRSVLKGGIPLGRILHQNRIETVRMNFSNFALADPGYLPAIFRALAVQSPAYRKWLAEGHSLRCCRTAPEELHPQSHLNKTYIGRSYELYVQEQQLAWIEEIFPPDLSQSLSLAEKK